MCGDLISKEINATVNLIMYLPEILIRFLSFVLTFSLVLSLSPIHSVEASEIKNHQLIQRIAKDYANKFCNSVAFGLSQESAMTFANKENYLIFKKKKGFESLNQKSIASQVSIKVIEDCGYLINLRGEDGITQFENDYISMNNYYLHET